MRELEDSGRISWPAFLARRVRRLLPAAMLVLAVTAVGTWFLIPGLRRHEVGADLIAAALYVVNWLLGSRSVNYLHSDAVPSPVQHYWSLAVEEQFYVIWPLLILVSVAVLRSLPRRRLLAVLLALVGAPSFAWSVWLTTREPEAAYFVTTTRVWELAIGAGLAVFLAGRAPRHTDSGSVRATTLAVTGLALVLGTAFLLPHHAGWPGAWAALPTVGTALVLYAGWSAPGRGVAAFLAWRPLVWVGGLSYSLCLWHWPVRVLAQWALGPARWVPIVAVAASVLPAWVAHRYVEVPLHTGQGWASRVWSGSPRPWLVAGAALSLVGVLAGSAMFAARSPFRTTPPPGSGEVALGAAALGSPPSQRDVLAPSNWLTPDPLRAGEDRPAADVDHCQVDVQTSVPVRCDFGAADPTRTIALVGDSKAMQWLPALQPTAATQRWRLVTYGKGSCTYSTAHASRAGGAYPQCDDWNVAVTAALRELRPDLVVTSANPSVLPAAGRSAREAARAGFTEKWRELSGAGIPVLVLGNSPQSPDDLDVCAARHPRDLGQCAYDRAAALARNGNADLSAAALAAGVDYLDLTDWICPGERCPVAIGHVTVARPGDHVTATYARSLAPVVGAAVRRSLERADAFGLHRALR